VGCESLFLTTRTFRNPSINKPTHMHTERFMGHLHKPTHTYTYTFAYRCTPLHVQTHTPHTQTPKHRNTESPHRKYHRRCKCQQSEPRPLRPLRAIYWSPKSANRDLLALPVRALSCQRFRAQKDVVYSRKMLCIKKKICVFKKRCKMCVLKKRYGSSKK